jgi:MoaA/NifB/PqqE/SkfB family radical SAM enzyme
MDTLVGKTAQTAKIPEAPLTRLETLWLQVGGTLCNLQCTHCFISCGPQNHNHEMMTLRQVRSALEEARPLGVRDYYITGGEVFVNPEIFEILEAILAYGPLSVLTNGTLITPEKAARLRAIRERAGQSLEFRVSMEGFDERANDKVRGAGSFRRAVAGLRNLGAAGFSPILTVTRSWDEERDADMETQFLKFLAENHVPRPRVKILPAFLLGRQAETDRPYNPDERVTERCFENYPITSLQCATCRLVAADGVYVCPILAGEPAGRMGGGLRDALRPYPLAHPACYTCRVTGMTCKS